MKVIIDTSVWLDYFKFNLHEKEIKELHKEGRIVTTDVILAELLPIIIHDKKRELESALRSFETLHTFVNWEAIISTQVKCLKNGYNRIGLLDIMIVQAAIEYSAKIYSVDKHFKGMEKFLDFKLHIP